MDIAGRIRINLPTDLVIEACLKPQNLELLLPVPGKITRIDETRYSLRLSPNTPLIRAKVSGDLAITPAASGRQFDLEGSAKVALVGGVKLTGAMEFVDVGTGCLLVYSSEVSGSGLVGRMIASREDAMRQRLQEGLKALRKRIVRGHARSVAAEAEEAPSEME